MLDTIEYALQEQVADYAHEAWAGWIRYMFGLALHNADGTLTLPAQSVERWTRQASTPYADLPEDEKASDRREARKILDIVIGT